MTLRTVAQPVCAGNRAVFTWLLTMLVFAGGVYPALYGPLQPHEHLFVGGPPPADWEDHSHPNPLFVLLGSPGGMVAMTTNVDATQPGVANRIATGKVVSVFSTDPTLLTQFLAFVVLVPPVSGLEPPGLDLWMATGPLDFDSQLSGGPAPPPPRAR